MKNHERHQRNREAAAADARERERVRRVERLVTWLFAECIVGIVALIVAMWLSS